MDSKLIVAVLCFVVASAHAYWSPTLTINRKCCASGDPHYYTFDGYVIHFQGDCKYLLAGTCPCSNHGLTPFHVYVDNDKTSPGSTVSVTKTVFIEIGGHEIVFSAYSPTCTVDGIDCADLSLPHTIPGVGTVSCTGAGYKFESVEGIIVTYEYRHKVCVTVPCKYDNEMCGICGNNNQLSGDDCHTSDGTNVCGNPNEWTLVGNSWQVYDPNACDGEEVVASLQVPTDVDPGYCNVFLNPTQNPATTLEQCVADNPTEGRGYYQSCIYDSTYAGTHCPVFEAFVSEVCEGNAAGWREDYDCPMNCPSNMHYVEEVCPRPCRQIVYEQVDHELELQPIGAIGKRQTTRCPVPTIGEGCMCQTGYYRYGDQCVRCQLRGR